jgi:DNA-binding NarL/FixJ family response regulator
MRPAKDTAEIRTTRLFLVIENRLLREAMSAIFRQQEGVSLIGSAQYSSLACRQMVESHYDILLADQASASAFPANFIDQFLARISGRKVILFGMDDNFEIFLQAIRSGVSGYLLGEASAEDTIAAVRKVAVGEAVSPPKLCHDLFQFVARSTREGSMILNGRLCRKLGLTARQQQLVALLARGFTNKEIAESMRLSEFTVKNHVHRIMRQLNAESRYEAVRTVCESDLAASL